MPFDRNLFNTSRARLYKRYRNNKLLVMSAQPNIPIDVGNDIRVTVVSMRRNSCTLAIEAPGTVPIERVYHPIPDPIE